MSFDLLGYSFSNFVERQFEVNNLDYLEVGLSLLRPTGLPTGLTSDLDQVRLILWELEAVRDLLVFKPISNLLLEHLELVLHLRVNVSFCVREHLAKRSVAYFVTISRVISLQVVFSLGRSVGKLHRLVAILNDLVKHLPPLLARRSHYSLLSVFRSRNSCVAQQNRLDVVNLSVALRFGLLRLRT